MYIYPNVTLIDDDFVTSKFRFLGKFLYWLVITVRNRIKTSEAILTDGNNQDHSKFVQLVKGTRYYLRVDEMAGCVTKTGNSDGGETFGSLWIAFFASKSPHLEKSRDRVTCKYRPDNNCFDSPYIIKEQAVKMTAVHKYLSASWNLAGPQWSMDRPSIL